MHVAQQVGGGIGIHFLDDVGGAVGVQRTENRNLQLGIDLLQGLGGYFLVQSLEDGFALGRRQVLHDVGNVGRMQLGQAVKGDLQLDAAGRIGLDEIDKLPRDHPGRNSLQQQVQRGRRHHALQQPADGSARTHVHRANLEHNVVVASSPRGCQRR